jgi:hypothetical protein
MTTTGTGPPGTEQRGPFDRILRTDADGAPQPPDRAAIYIGGLIIGLGLLLLILVLPPISILSGGGGGDGDIPTAPGTADKVTSEPRRNVPKLPAGLTAASLMFELSAPADQQGASGVTLPLKEKQNDERSLALYTYRDNKWDRLSDVAVIAGGMAARGDVEALPGNVIVLKQSKSTIRVAGAAGAGAEIDPRAAGVLTVLHPIVFLPADDGTLVGNPPAVPPAAYSVVPAIVAPNPEVVNNILRTEALRTAHAQAIADAVRAGNYHGIDVDYRDVNPQLKEQFTQFIEDLSQKLDQDGRELTLTLPMPTSNGGEVDPGAYDWDALGAAADSIEMAGELDQDLYFQRTEAALDYVTQHADRAKLLLTISTLSVERGSDGLRAMPLDDALTIASVVGVRTEDEITAGEQVRLVAQNLAQSEGASGLEWDDTSRAVRFKYPGLGGERTLWLANAFSAAFRLELAQRYNLGGVALTDVSAESGSSVWDTVQNFAETNELTLVKPNGDLFLPSWTASDGAIAPSGGDETTWTAPAAEGPYEITLIVSDGVERVGQRITINVSPAAPVAPAAEPTVAAPEATTPAATPTPSSQ